VAATLIIRRSYNRISGGFARVGIYDASRLLQGMDVLVNANSDLRLINDICDEFEDAWREAEAPVLQEFVARVGLRHQENLVKELLPLDVEYRLKSEECLDFGLYREYGEEKVESAKKIAAQILEARLFKESSGEDDLVQTLSHNDGVAVARPTHESSQIGPYKLLQKLGEGGMGTVWMAEQEKPVRRRVAIKLIKNAITDKQVIARFEAERQALSMMDHPSIARVLDAGTSESGNPFFVMELVRGIAINEYCDRNKLTPDQRLEIFVPVCKAVQHAHQKGVIHRDLKPSNVLVQMQDGEPVAKVIDFGLVKALDQSQRLTDKTMFTEFGQVVGTLQYMSPEQATMDAMSVDTRTDIYSLGVMLYELLAGSTPVEKETLEQNAMLRVLEAIREKDPPKPSHRLSSAGEKLTTISELRQIQPTRLQQILRGELDWIVMKALEKDRTRRYESASAFAQDIDNYLNGDAVQARPQSSWYQLQKFARKNKGLVASIVAIGLLLLAGIAGTSFGLVQANLKTAESIEERKRADVEKDRAEENANRALEMESVAAVEAERAQKSEAKANFQLAIARWDAGRTGEAREQLQLIPEKYRESFEWNLCNRQFLGSDLTLYGHSKSVNCVSLSPDGQWIVSGGEDKSIKLWSQVTGAEICTFRGHTEGVHGVAFSPDGTRIVSGSGDSTVKLWDVQNKREIATLEGHEDSVSGVAFSPDGQQILSGSWDGDVILWETGTGKELKRFVGRTDDDNDVRFYRKKGASVRKNSRVTCVQFSLNGLQVAAGRMNDNIDLWNTKTGQKMYRIDSYERRDDWRFDTAISDISFSPDGTQFASRSQSKVRLWDLKTGEEVLENNWSPSVGKGVAYSPDGTWVASGNRDGRILVKDTKTGKEIYSLKGHSNDVMTIVFNVDGSRIISGGADGTVKVWDVKNGSCNFGVEPQKYSWALAFSDDGSKFASGSGVGEVTIWNSQTRKKISTFGEIGVGIQSADFSPSGEYIATGNQDDSAKIWSVETGKLLRTLRGHKDSVRGVEFSPDGKWIATGSADFTAKIWDLETGKIVHSLEGHGFNVTCLNFSPNGKKLLTGAWDDHAVLWDLETGEQELAVWCHHRAVSSVAFSPDGKKFACGNTFGVLSVWDAKNGQELYFRQAHPREVFSVAFTSNGTRIVTGSDDDTIKFWEADTGREIYTLHTEASKLTEFSPDGQQMVSSNSDESLEVWDANLGQEVHYLKGHQKEVNSVTFSSDGKRIFSESASERLVWDVEKRAIIATPDVLNEGSKRRISSNGRWLVTFFGRDVLLVDLDYKNTPNEQIYRSSKAKLDLVWHQSQAKKNELEKNWLPATFHWGWSMKADPDQTTSHDGLHASFEKLKNAKAKPAENLDDYLAPVVKEMLKLPRGKSVPKLTPKKAWGRNKVVWAKVRATTPAERRQVTRTELLQFRELVEQFPQASYFSTLAAAEFRMRNFEKATKAALNSVELRRKKQGLSSPHPVDLAILAMSYFELKDLKKAKKYRSELDEAMESEINGSDEECISIAKEAEAFFDTAKAFKEEVSQ